MRVRNHAERLTTIMRSIDQRRSRYGLSHADALEELATFNRQYLNDLLLMQRGQLVKKVCAKEDGRMRRRETA